MADAPKKILGPDNLFYSTTPDGIEVEINKSDAISGILTGEGKAIDAFFEAMKSTSALRYAFGVVGLVSGAVISALENNAQGLHVTDNFQKTVLDGLASYTGAETGAAIGLFFGSFLGPVGAAVGQPTGAILGGVAGGIFSNNVYPGIQAQLLASSKASAVQANWNAGLPYTLISTTPGVPSIDIYSSGRIVVSALGVTINPDASITTSSGTVYYTPAVGASPNFSANFVPTFGGPQIPFDGQFNTDTSGNVTLNLLTADENGIPRASNTINLTPSAGNLVQEADDPSTQTSYFSLQNPNTTQDWATVLLRLNGTVVTQETVTDRGGNTFTFGYDGNGAVDVETIAQANTGSTAVYSFDTLNQQPWTTAETLFQNGQPTAVYVFNRDGTVQLNNYAPTGQLTSDTLYTTNVGALETVYDIVGNQAYSAYQVQMNAALQATTITQYERNGDVYIDSIDPATGLVKTDTHTRANGGNTTVTYNDYLGNQSCSTIVSNYTAAGANVDQTVYDRD